MANLSKKGIEVSSATRKKGDTEVSSNSQTTGLTGDQKFSLIMAVSIGVGVASVLAMLAMLVSWLQFASSSFNDYKDTVRQYNDDRYKTLEMRIQLIETKESSLPANISE